MVYVSRAPPFGWPKELGLAWLDFKTSHHGGRFTCSAQGRGMPLHIPRGCADHRQVTPSCSPLPAALTSCSRDRWLTLPPPLSSSPSPHPHPAPPPADPARDRCGFPSLAAAPPDATHAPAASWTLAGSSCRTPMRRLWLRECTPAVRMAPNASLHTASHPQASPVRATPPHAPVPRAWRHPRKRCFHLARPAVHAA